MFLTIIAFVAVLAVLVLAHELGHFWTAKKTGMEVEEFGFGFPPRIFSFTRGGTRYSINLLPLGGFVKIKGENGEEEATEGSFMSKSVPARILVLSAGVIMNILLAWVLLSAALVAGAPQAVNDEVTGYEQNRRILIGDVEKDSPADTAGIKAGDIIVSIDGQKVNTVEEVQNYTRSHAGQTISYGISRNGESVKADFAPRQNTSAGQGAAGISLVAVADVSYPWPKAIVKGLEMTWDYLSITVSGFIALINGFLGGPSVAGQVSGPVGIAVMTGQFARMGIVALMQFMAILSVNLAILNILPIPALDGGRIVFTLIEGIRGKRVRAKIEQWSHAIGFIALITLMLVVTFKDVIQHVPFLSNLF